MRKKYVICFILTAAVLALSSCVSIQDAAYLQASKPTVTAAQTAAPTPQTANPAPGSTVIRGYAYTNELPNIVDSYIAAHPDFGYTVEWYYPPDAYEPDLDGALAAGGPEAPDIYVAEYAFVGKYTWGEMSGYAMPYEELGLDVDAGIAKAQIAPYIVDVGTRSSDGKVVGLAYQGTGGAFIYRRSIAKDVWGTDDPAFIASKVGPGWDKFFEAAGELKKKGYSIVSGADDIWYPLEGSTEHSLLRDGKISIDQEFETYFDYTKELIDKGYTNDTQAWTEGWYDGMAGKGPRPVFGFFGPAWLVNYVIARNCGAAIDEDYRLIEAGGTWGDWAVCQPPAKFFWGGMWVLANKQLENDPAKKAAVARLIDWITLQCGEDSLQYAWANGSLPFLHGVKDTVASKKVMAMCDGTTDILGGQDMYDVFMPASDVSNKGTLSGYDNAVYWIWRDYAVKYAHGEYTREEAIAAFKQYVKELYGFDAM